MILADTSIWVDHFRSGVDALAERLVAGEILIHPCVIGELALGNLARRDTILSTLAQLPRAPVATDDEMLRFIGANRLAGVGIGYVDAHLLASVRLSADARLWTRDRRLLGVAEDLGVAIRPPG